MTKEAVDRDRPASRVETEPLIGVPLDPRASGSTVAAAARPGEISRVVRSVSIVSAAKILLVVTSLLRTMVIAAVFGSGRLTDAFFIAYLVPEMIHLRLMVPIMGGFVPVMVGCVTREDRETARRLLWTLLNGTLLACGGIAALGYLATAPLMGAVAPGFTSETHTVATRLLWIVLPMIFFTTSAVVVQGALEAHKRFTISAIAPVLFNLCVLAGAWILGRRFGIEGLAYGFLFGSVVQLAVQLPSFHRLGLAPGLYLDLKHPAVRQVLWLMLPIFLDNLVVITVRFVENNLASHLESGSISALGYALRLHGVPVGLFAYGLVTVILPYLSTHHETRNHDQFRKTSSFGMRGLLLLCTPIMVLFLLLARDIVDVIYRHEVFDEASAEVTAHVFRLLSIGLVAQGLTLYFCKVLYALRNTFVILKVSIFVATLNVLFDLVAVRYLGVGAIALGASLAWSANAAILFWILHRHGHALDVRGDAGFLVKIALAGIVTAVVVAGTDAAAGSAWNVLESSLGRCVILGGLGSVAFLAACAVSRIEELRYVTRLLRSRRPGGDTGGERR